jgi:hypothetical protein
MRIPAQARAPCDTLTLCQESIEANVRRGSRVYEEGHVLVLGWCTSQRDLEVVWKSLEQVGCGEGALPCPALLPACDHGAPWAV